MSRLLVICPSRGRPAALARMIESFKETSTESTLVVLLDNDDPKLTEYQDTIKDTAYTIEPRRSITDIINERFQSQKNEYEFFSVSNDDFIYRTSNWDTKLIETIEKRGPGIAYGNDLLAGEVIPTTSIVSSQIVKALGWLQMPRLKHLFNDNVFKYLGQKCRCLYYMPEVIIEHMHFFNGKAEKDLTYEISNSMMMYKHDEEAFMEWVNKDAPNDVIKVRSAILKYTQEIKKVGLSRG